MIGAFAVAKKPLGAASSRHPLSSRKHPQRTVRPSRSDRNASSQSEVCPHAKAKMAFIAPLLLRPRSTPATALRARPCACPPRVARLSMTATTPAGAFAAGVETLQDEGAYAVMAAAAEVEAATGKKVVHLEIGQPGFDTPGHVAAAGVEAIEAGRTKYSAPAGVASLRAAIAEWVRQHRGMDVGPDEVVVGPGAKPGLFFTTLALVRGPEDEVVIPDPGFPTYRAMAEVARGTVVPVRLRADMRSFDMEAFERSVGERTRLVVINSPGNPTGGVGSAACV